MLLLGCLHGSTESNLSARWGWERTAKEQMAPPSYSQYWLVNHWLPRWHCDKELPCYCRRNKRPGLDPWIGKISWRRKWQPAPVFFIPGSKRYPGGGNGNPLQYSSSLDWEDLLKEEMATCSSILAWQNPQIEEPDRLWTIASLRVGQDWSKLAGMHASYMISPQDHLYGDYFSYQLWNL